MPFAAYEGVKGGEFYTPASVVKTIVAVLKPFSNCRVYDPAVVPAECSCRVQNLFRLILGNGGRLQFMANPPFNLSYWGHEKLKEDKRWKYGIPPAGNANYAWIQHMIHHLAPNGKLGLVLADGVLSTQSGGEGEIRKKIIEDDLVEGIIAMPTQLFYSVTIPVTLWFITKNKKQKRKTLFIDARKMDFMVDRKHRDFDDEKDIPKIAETFAAFEEGKMEDVKGFCAAASLADIAKQDYILMPGRWILWVVID